MIHSLGDRKVVTKSDCWVADNVTVIGSVVLEHDISIWFNTAGRADGMPGKVVRELTDEEVARLLWNAEHCVKTFQRYWKDPKPQKP